MKIVAVTRGSSAFQIPIPRRARTHPTMSAASCLESPVVMLWTNAALALVTSLLRHAASHQENRVVRITRSVAPEATATVVLVLLSKRKALARCGTHIGRDHSPMNLNAMGASVADLHEANL
jgi:hypothetical protein